MMLAASKKPVAVVLIQHVEDAVVLRNIRSGLVAAPHVKLHHLKRFDDRLAAHLDALNVAGDDGWSVTTMALEDPGPAEVFVAAVCALRDQRLDRVEHLLALTEAQREATAGLISAFGWLSAPELQGVVRSLLVSPAPFRRAIGIGACAVHRVDPGPPQTEALRDSDADVRARGFRTAGQLGLTDLAPVCEAAINGDDPESRFWAAWSAVMFGNRGIALNVLTEHAFGAGHHRRRAFRLALQAMKPAEGHSALQPIARAEGGMRWLIEGSGIVGDPMYVPWLIAQMSDDQTARLAGEAFSLITGTDLALLDLERKPPEDFESGPNDNPEDRNVAMDPDDDLPWPDRERVENWWAVNGSRFQNGNRYFMGERISRALCVDVLKNGYQRQRILAAHYLCLFEPGTPLFNTSAPVRRQQRLLARMS